jgi:carboxylesterase type B
MSNPVNPVITIEDGSLKGQILKTNTSQFYSFKGIPYAKPPVEGLRFSVSKN